MSSKACIRCSVIKSFTAFFWRNKKQGIRENICKQCRTDGRSHSKLAGSQPNTKICTRCAEPKALTEFDRRWDNPSKYHGQCKACRKLPARTPQGARLADQRYRNKLKNKIQVYMEPYHCSAICDSGSVCCGNGSMKRNHI